MDKFYENFSEISQVNRSKWRPRWFILKKSIKLSLWCDIYI